MTDINHTTNNNNNDDDDDEEEKEEDEDVFGDVDGDGGGELAAFSDIHLNFMNCDIFIFSNLNAQLVAVSEILPSVNLLLARSVERKNVAVTKSVVDMLCDMCMKFHTVGISRVGSLLTLQRSSEGPCSVMVCLVCVVSTISSIIEEVTEVYVPEWFTLLTDEQAKATAVDEILLKGCVASTSPISEYKMSEFLDALYLLSDNWNDLDLHQCSVYIEQLFLRGCKFVTTLLADRNYDVEEYVERKTAEERLAAVLSGEGGGGGGGEDGDEEEDRCGLITSNMRFKRMVVGPLCKMLCVVDFVETYETKIRHAPASLEERALFKKMLMRRYNEMANVSQPAQLVSSIDTLAQKAKLKYCDVEKFQEEYVLIGLEMKAVIQGSHNNDSLFSMALFPQQVDTKEDLLIIDEARDDYLLNCSFNRRMHVINAKLLLFDAMFVTALQKNKLQEFSFMSRFVMEEIDIIVQRPLIDAAEVPMIVVLQGRPLLLANKKLYNCHGIDGCLLQWMNFVCDKMDGVVHEVRLEPALRFLLNGGTTATATATATTTDSKGRTGFVNLV